MPRIIGPPTAIAQKTAKNGHVSSGHILNSATSNGHIGAGCTNSA